MTPDKPSSSEPTENSLPLIEVTLNESGTSETGVDPMVPGASSQNLPASIGRFRLVRKLGEGGMGSVWLAHDEQLDRQVAMKIPTQIAGNQMVIQRFMQEGRTAATLSHPGLCQILEADCWQGIYYLVMSFVQGEPLNDRLKQGPLNPQEAADLTRRIALALEVAHQKGVIHRDLKPANIILTPEGEPVVVDFGLAKRTTDGQEGLTQSGTVMGTPAYMSPEQVEGRVNELGPATDVYSMGVILHELLAGEPPFRGTLGQVMSQILKEKPPELQKIPRGLAQIAQRAMQKDPKQRYASMKEFAQALEQWQHTQKVPASPRRWPWIAAAFAGLLAIGLAVVLFINSSKGKIRIEVNDPNAVVLVDGEQIRIENLGDAITLKPGKHGLIIKRGDVVVETRDFTVQRGDNPVLKITLPDPPRVVQKKPKDPDKVTNNNKTNGDNKPSVVVRPKPEFRPLFNGKDLTGWEVANGDPEAIKVEDGKLIVGLNDQWRGWLMTDRYFSDFELTLEFALAEGGNSGIGFWTAMGEGAPNRTALGVPEIQILDDPGYEGKVTAKQTTGALYDLAKDQEAELKPRGEWNRARVEVRDQKLLVEINGKEVVKTHLGSFVDQAGKIPGFKRKTGRIALQNWGTRVEFRNVQIKDLQPPPLPSLPEVQEDFVSLFNGKDLNGWTPMVTLGQNSDRHVAATEGWKVEDGAIVCTTADAGWLKSDKAYENFHLAMEFKLPPGANSGLYVRTPLEGNLAKKVIEIQMVENDTISSALKPEQATGAIFGVSGAVADVMEPAGQWNTLEVRCEGDWIETRINGILVAEANVAESEALRNRSRSGVLGISNWGGQAKGCAFRKIRIKPLPAPEPKDKDFAPLFSGENFPWDWDLAGGVAVNEVANLRAGVLTCQGNVSGYLLTDKKYNDYVFRYQWRYQRPPGLARDDLFPGKGAVFVHATIIALGQWPKSYQISQNRSEQGRIAALNGAEFEDLQFDEQKMNQAKRPVGEWNQMEITCKGNSITTKLNGGIVSQATVKQTEGLVCIKTDGSLIRYRNFEIKSLK